MASPDAAQFFREFVAPARPAVIEAAPGGWLDRLGAKWTREYLGAAAGRREVHVKLADRGVFEGVEDAALWGATADDLPDAVRAQLVDPDLVVVRPADMAATVGEVLDLIEEQGRSGGSAQAYLEYLPLRSSIPRLADDLGEKPFARLLRFGMHTNLWLGGATRGKLHFDEYDNIMQMVRGRKRFVVYSPENNRALGEGHLREAKLGYDPATGLFSRAELHDSTAMVMSPVDLERPDLARYPQFANATAAVCEVGPGESLFLPAFWWHEVESTPDDGGLTVGINTWYEPLWNKEFPCAECRRELNGAYADTVRTVFGLA